MYRFDAVLYSDLSCVCADGVQEFVQAEIDREEAAIVAEREKARRTEERSNGVEERVQTLRNQLVTLQEGISQVPTPTNRV